MIQRKKLQDTQQDGFCQVQKHAGMRATGVSPFSAVMLSQEAELYMTLGALKKPGLLHSHQTSQDLLELFKGLL